jgi:hypothetical protein
MPATRHSEEGSSLMPGPGTSFEAPLLVGTRPQSSPTTPWINDFGSVVIEQDITLAVATGTGAVSGTIYVPTGSELLDVMVDTMVVFNSGTTDVLSLGTAAADTSYASGVNVHTPTGRQRPTFTAAQLINMGNVAAPGELVATITQGGTAATTGSVVARVLYTSTTQPFTGNT